VNDSSWEIGVTLQLDLPAEAKLEKIGEGRGIGPVARTGAGNVWKVALKPYDLAAARFTTAGVRVRGAQAATSQQVRQNLQRRIEDLGSRVAALGNPQPLGVLETQVSTSSRNTRLSPAGASWPQLGAIGCDRRAAATYGRTIAQAHQRRPEGVGGECSVSTADDGPAFRRPMVESERR